MIANPISRRPVCAPLHHRSLVKFKYTIKAGHSADSSQLVVANCSALVLRNWRQLVKLFPSSPLAVPLELSPLVGALEQLARLRANLAQQRGLAAPQLVRVSATFGAHGLQVVFCFSARLVRCFLWRGKKCFLLKTFFHSSGGERTVWPTIKWNSHFGNLCRRRIWQKSAADHCTECNCLCHFRTPAA